MSKPSDTSEMRKKYAVRKGRLAEWRARLALMFTGHRILASNYRTPVGEIDIIAKRGDAIRFIEVKARDSLEQAAEAVSARQRTRIQRAAEYFLMQTPVWQRCTIRFDVCLAVGPWRLKWLNDAWRP